MLSSPRPFPAWSTSTLVFRGCTCDRRIGGTLGRVVAGKYDRVSWSAILYNYSTPGRPLRQDANVECLIFWLVRATIADGSIDLGDTTSRRSWSLAVVSQRSAVLAVCESAGYFDGDVIAVRGNALNADRRCGQSVGPGVDYRNLTRFAQINRLPAKTTAGVEPTPSRRLARTGPPLRVLRL